MIYDWAIERRCNACRKVKPISSFKTDGATCSTCERKRPRDVVIDAGVAAALVARCPSLRFKGGRFYYDTNVASGRKWVDLGRRVERALNMYAILRWRDGKTVPEGIGTPPPQGTEELKIAAREAVQRAVKEGILVRGRCEDCGAPNAHGHHDSYAPDQWLKVRWLCSKHHLAEHGMRTYVERLHSKKAG